MTYNLLWLRFLGDPPQAAGLVPYHGPVSRAPLARAPDPRLVNELRDASGWGPVPPGGEPHPAAFEPHRDLVHAIVPLVDS